MTSPSGRTARKAGLPLTEAWYLTTLPLRWEGHSRRRPDRGAGQLGYRHTEKRVTQGSSMRKQFTMKHDGLNLFGCQCAKSIGSPCVNASACLTRDRFEAVRRCWIASQRPFHPFPVPPCTNFIRSVLFAKCYRLEKPHDRKRWALSIGRRSRGEPWGRPT